MGPRPTQGDDTGLVFEGTAPGRVSRIMEA